MPKVQLPRVLHTYQNRLIDSTRWVSYSPRNDDIIISTSIKSGTTWVQGIVRELIIHGLDSQDLDAPGRVPLPNNQSSPWLDWRARDINVLHEQLEAQAHRRFIKTHLPLDGLPFYPQVKYLVIGRDARDVFMSLWNHYENWTDAAYKLVNESFDPIGDPFPRCPENILVFWQSWINRGWFEWEQEGYPFWGNMHHTQTWWNFRHLDNIHFSHYADLLADPKGEIERIAKFLGFTVTDEALTTIVQNTSLSAMRQRGIETGTHQNFKEGADTFFFKGTNGRWRDVLSEEKLTMYETTKAQVLAPDCARWLEQGRVALS